MSTDVGNYRPKYLVVAGKELFTKIQYDALGNPETHATHFDIGRVQAMAYDQFRGKIFKPSRVGQNQTKTSR